MKKFTTILFLLLLTSIGSVMQAQTVDFYPPAKVYKSMSNIGEIRSGDVTGEGIPDLIVGGTDTLYVLKGQGDGSFVKIWQVYVGAYYDLKIADFNNDGKLDLAIAILEGIISGVTVDFYLGLMINNGSGVFNTMTTLNIGGFVGELAVADFNKDGYLDVVSPTINELDPSYVYMSIFINNKNSTFKTGVRYNASTNITTAVTMRINALDVNDDGYVDVVQPYGGYDSLAVYLNKSDGTFNAYTKLLTPGGVGSTYVLDMDLDGINDLTMIGQSLLHITNPPYQFGFYLAKSGGNSQNVLNSYANSYRGGLLENVVNDVNHDGKYDVTILPSYYNSVTSTNYDSLKVFLNQGNLTYNISTPAYSSAIEYFYSFIGADFNSDNLPDYAYIASADSSVKVILQKSIVTSTTSALTSESTLQVYPNPSSGTVQINTSGFIKTIMLYDSMGRLAYSEQQESEKQAEQLDVSTLAKGLYLLQVENDKGGMSAVHLVLQ
jgi:hypothetical protein